MSLSVHGKHRISYNYSLGKFLKRETKKERKRKNYERNLMELGHDLASAFVTYTSQHDCRIKISLRLQIRTKLGKQLMPMCDRLCETAFVQRKRVSFSAQKFRESLFPAEKLVESFPTA